MKFYKISQNIEYLEKIGVPPEFQKDILNHLLSLDKDTRKVILRKIKKNPTMNLREIKELEADTKKDYLRGQGYDESIVDAAIKVSPKYSVWVAREIKRFREKAISNYDNLINYATEITEKYKVKDLYEAESFMTPEEKQKVRVLRSTKPLIDKDKKYLPNMIPWEGGVTHGSVRGIIDYIEQNDPDIMSMSYEDARNESEKWHEELKQKALENTLNSYKSHDVVYNLPDGWEIIKLEAGDCETEGEMMGHCVGGYARDVSEGNTEIYSLRDPKNMPHATLEMKFYEEENKKNITIRQIQGKGNDEPIPEYQAMIKQWFDSLKKNGYNFDPMGDDYVEAITVTDLEEYDQDNAYGMPISFSGIGGDVETYYDNLLGCYYAGNAGSHWYDGTAKKCFDDLLSYAVKHDELNDLESALDGFETSIYHAKDQKSIKIYKSFNDQVMEWWMDTEDYIQYENEKPYEEDYPAKEDFMIQPDTSEEQPEFNNMPEPQQIFNEKAYNKALQEYIEKEKAYEKETEEHQENFDPYIFQNYVYQEIKNVKQREEEYNNGNIKAEEKVAKMRTRIYKMAKKDPLSVDASAQYVDALKLFAKEHPDLNKKYADLIYGLPSSRKIKLDFSNEECIVLYETLEYLWKKITGESIIQETEVISSPETLFGNYWLIKNGILLKGVNHFSIIKQNTNVFCSLLNLNGMVLQEYLANKPNKVIEFILNNGGVRLFVNKDKKLFAQMSSKTYGKWGKAKIKKYDFKLKAVKVIDFKRPYTGWKSGITIKL